MLTLPILAHKTEDCKVGFPLLKCSLYKAQHGAQKVVTRTQTMGLIYYKIMLCGKII